MRSLLDVDFRRGRSVSCNHENVRVYIGVVVGDDDCCRFRADACWAGAVPADLGDVRSVAARHSAAVVGRGGGGRDRGAGDSVGSVRAGALESAGDGRADLGFGADGGAGAARVLRLSQQ